MQFIRNGCDIPKALLEAYLKGDVVFFCGAGVSKAKAKLPDFTGLTKEVLEGFGLSVEHKIYKLLEFIIDEKQQQKSLMGYSGLVSVDKIFSYLERDFPESEIRQKVCSALKPSPNVDLSAHKIMLKLANHNNKLKLVTTNFDRLFEQASDSLLLSKIFVPPQLPPLHFGEELDSLVYLHGCVNDDYTDSLSSHFVLSSADFGNAYLSDGWATQFLKSLLNNYHLVFIGYSADDPPVSYLLEALRKSRRNTRIYAFQNTKEDEGFLKWQSKGVNPIGFSDYNLLWHSLKAWGDIYNTEDWIPYCLNLASQEPSNLLPYQREQVMQFVTKAESIKQFLELSPPAPASWIFVFDPWLRTQDKEKSILITRYKDKTDSILEFDKEARFNFYDIYHIETDNIDDNKVIQTPYQLNALKINEDEGDIWFGNQFRTVGNLTLLERQHHLLNWIISQWQTKEIIYWLAYRMRNQQIHPEFFDKFSRLSINKYEHQESLNLWRGLYHIGHTHLSYYPQSHDYETYILEDYIKIFGWQLNTLVHLSQVIEPKLTIGSCHYSDLENNLPRIGFQVQYAELNILEHHINSQEKFVFDICLLFTKALEQGLQLENEYDCKIFSSYQFDFKQLESTDTHYLVGSDNYILYIAKLFNNLFEYDATLAIVILENWNKIKHFEFYKLSLWAFSNNYGQEFARTVFSDLLNSIPNDDLFDYKLRKELSTAIVAQWRFLTDEQKNTFEKRILQGESFPDDTYQKFNDRLALCWFDLLQKNNCSFSQNFAEQIEHLKQTIDYPLGEIDCDAYFNDSLYSTRVGWVSDDTDYSMLLNIPVDKILPTAFELKNRTHPQVFSEYAPFQGLCKDQPRLAFSALIASTVENTMNLSDLLLWAWTEFFNTIRDIALPKDFPDEIVTQLLKYSDDFLVNLRRPIISWFEQKIKEGVVEKTIRNQFIDKLIEVNKLIEADDITKDNDLSFNAINSLAGHLVHILYRIIEKNQMTPFFKQSVDKLLDPTNPNLAYTVFVLAENLNWLHSQDNDWTIKNLIPFSNHSDDTVRLGFWLGVLFGRIPSNQIFLTLKTGILSLDVQRINPSLNHDFIQKYLSIILSGWLTTSINSKQSLITNEEFRKIIEKYPDYLSSIVGQLRLWSSEQEVLNQVSNFFINIYPHQNQYKTQKNNNKLLEFLFDSETVFVESYESILPLLTVSTEQYHHFVYTLENEINDLILRKYPDKVLDILNVILPNNPNLWFYNAYKLLEIIESIQPSLGDNTVLKRLKYIWYNR